VPLSSELFRSRAMADRDRQILAGVLAMPANLRMRSPRSGPLSRRPDSTICTNNLGAALMRAGDLDRAERLCAKLSVCVRARPCASYLATLLARRGAFPRPVPSRASDPHRRLVRRWHRHMGRLLRRTEIGPSPRPLCRPTGLEPSVVEHAQQTSHCAGAVGRMRWRDREFRAALAIRREFPAAHYNLGAALAGAGRRRRSGTAF